MGAPPPGWASSFDLQADHLREGTSTAVTRVPAPVSRQRFLASLPPGYAEETAPEEAARDWSEMSRLAGLSGNEGGAGPPGAHLGFSPGRPGAPGAFRLRRVARHRVELSWLLRVLESFGLVAEEAVPWHFAWGELGDGYVDDIGLRAATPVAAGTLDPVEDGPRLVGALEAVMGGQGELSPLNRLVVGAGLSGREVDLLRAMCAYRLAVGGPRGPERAELMSEALVAFPAVAAAAVRLFRAVVGDGPGSAAARHGAGAARADVQAGLAAVPDLAHDEVLRELLAVVDATTRTNWSLGEQTIALKFASGELPFLPEPRPLAEVFVWSPDFVGLHLRFGPVARGGLRWSDRHSDLRAEVLGLARAQVKKNALIVPTGAKGAFVLRDDPAVGAERGRKGRDAYCLFVAALLDVTDNIVDGQVAHPPGVTCRDGDDPYLVVAPDKGTAEFSDLANAISEKRGFWLGDAFASGGSQGYDHKVLGITARGAWLAVRRHFRALGMDAQHDPLRVIGVGDMSGDVFGNGLLQSEGVCLVAAFDHRHVFVDPVPEPERSFAERLRLSRLRRSSWADYDLATASRGAAVYSRQAKQLELSAEVCSALGIGRGPLSPPELIRAVLQAPADLVFFGGVGTFVKAVDESDAEVDDRANDDVRVEARQLRARVICEGANLAVTQRARVSYARRGGRVNADFVDNSAGVAMSDREVNLKILLGLAVAGREMSRGQRDEVLKLVEKPVADAVLAEVARALVALDWASTSSATDLAAYEALLEDLQQAGQLNRQVEVLPGDEELARRKQAGAGLSRPELAVLFAYARSELARSIESSPLAVQEALAPCALRYFPLPDLPAGPRELLARLVPEHPLVRQLVAVELANEIVNRMGALWAHELAAESGQALSAVAGAYWAARQVAGAESAFADLDGPGWSLPAPAEGALRDHAGAALDRLSRWYLHRRPPRRPGDAIDQDGPAAAALREVRRPPGPAHAELVALGAPPPAADRAVHLGRVAAAGELAQAARASGRALGAALGAYPVVEDGLFCAPLEAALRRRPTPDRWERWQVHALVDDLAHSRAAALTEALRGSPRGDGDGDGAAAARRWLERQAAAVGRARSLAQAAARATPPGLSLLALAVRAVGEAVGEAVAGPEPGGRRPRSAPASSPKR